LLPCERLRFCLSRQISSCRGIILVSHSHFVSIVGYFQSSCRRVQAIAALGIVTYYVFLAALQQFEVQHCRGRQFPQGLFRKTLLRRFNEQSATKLFLCYIAYTQHFHRQISVPIHKLAYSIRSHSYIKTSEIVSPY